MAAGLAAPDGSTFAPVGAVERRAARSAGRLQRRLPRRPPGDAAVQLLDGERAGHGPRHRRRERLLAGGRLVGARGSTLAPPSRCSRATRTAGTRRRSSSARGSCPTRTTTRRVTCGRTSSAGCSPTPCTCRPGRRRDPGRSPGCCTRSASSTTSTGRSTRSSSSRRASAAGRSARPPSGGVPTAGTSTRPRSTSGRSWHALSTGFALDPERTVAVGLLDGRVGHLQAGPRLPRPVRQGGRDGRPAGVRHPRHRGRRAAAPVPAAARTTARRCRCSPTPGGCRTSSLTAAADQLVPVTGVVEHVADIDALGLRHRFELYPALDHLAWAAADLFASPAAHMGAGKRTRDPGRITYSWFPHLRRPELGIGPTGAYWVRGLRARNAGPGVLASIDVTSAARPDPAVTPVRTSGPVLTPDTPPVAGHVLGADVAARLPARGAAADHRPAGRRGGAQLHPRSGGHRAGPDRHHLGADRRADHARADRSGPGSAGTGRRSHRDGVGRRGTASVALAGRRRRPSRSADRLGLGDRARPHSGEDVPQTGQAFEASDEQDAEARRRRRPSAAPPIASVVQCVLRYSTAPNTMSSPMAMSTRNSRCRSYPPTSTSSTTYTETDWLMWPDGKLSPRSRGWSKGSCRSSRCLNRSVHHAAKA